MKKTYLISLSVALAMPVGAHAQDSAKPISEIDKSDYRCLMMAGMFRSQARAKNDQKAIQFFTNLGMFYLGKLTGRDQSVDLAQTGPLSKAINGEDMSKYIDSCYKQLDQNIAKLTGDAP